MEKPSAPPQIISVNDRMLLQYAVLTDSVGFSAGHGLLFIGSKEIGRVPCLAICEDKEPGKFNLYFCDNDWSPIGIAVCESVRAARDKAERIYSGSSVHWVEAQFTEADVSRFVDETSAAQRCSFCGKRPDETLSIFEGNGNVRICDDCIRQFSSQLNDSG